MIFMGDYLCENLANLIIVADQRHIRSRVQEQDTGAGSREQEQV
jgi:hypothetical protein